MRRITPFVVASGLTLAAAVLVLGAAPAGAAQPPVGLGTATNFAVLAGSTVTNTGPSVIHGGLGLSPGTATPGVNSLPGPATVDGQQHINDPVAAQAKIDLTTAYNDAAGRKPVTSVGADLAGRTLKPGIYASPTLGLTGTLTLDANNNPAAIFVFKAASTLITASSSRVNLVGVSPCNVFWQVGSSATLGTNSRFVGTVMALASITATTGAVIRGRLLARTGAVTLDDNTITRPSCDLTKPSSPAPTSSTPARGGGGGGTSTPAGGGTSTPAGGGRSTPAGGGPGVPLRSPGTGTATSSTTPPNVTSTSPSESTPGQPPVLARTGGNNGTLAVGGVLAIVVGGSILLIARRRTANGPHRH